MAMRPQETLFKIDSVLIALKDEICSKKNYYIHLQKFFILKSDQCTHYFRKLMLQLTLVFLMKCLDAPEFQKHRNCRLTQNTAQNTVHIHL